MSTTLACGHCGAALRSDQSWCMLCHTHVPAAFDPLTAPIDQVLGHAPPPDASTERAVPEVSAAVAPIADPLSVEPAPGGSEVADAADSEGEGPGGVPDIDVMFSMLAAQHKATDPAASLMGRLDDRSTRLAIMVGGAMVIGTVLFVGLTVLGAIL